MPNQPKKFWEDGAGFFGRNYMEGDDSLEGFLTTPLGLRERTAREVDGIVRLLALEPGMRILDCPCGYGRHSVGLAQRGFEVVGVDLNTEMLERAVQCAAGVERVTFVKENMLHLVYQREFDAVLNLFFSFGFFEAEEENERNLSRFFDALVTGGSFMMHTDINVSRITTGSYRFHEKRHLRSGRVLEIQEGYDREAKKLTGQWILLGPDGRQELPRYRHTIYTFEEFAELCRKVGFADVRGYGDWDGLALAQDSEEMIVIARKP
jgi:ubiquinone/menaquinone biosynthesis C-methylase UbiE